MVMTQRRSNGTLAVLQCAVSIGRATLSRMRSIPTTDPVPAPAAPVPTVARLHADLAALQAELTSVRAERDQLRGLLADLLQLRAQLADTQVQLAAVEAERHQTRQELVDLKRKPFTARSQSDSTTPAKPRGREAGHPGSGRPRPTRIDHIQAIPAGDTCPDCGTAFSGSGTTRSRVVEDIVLVRPTVITKYLIERRCCPACRTYHDAALTEALPRDRLGLHVLLFVVCQKVALGLSYSKIQRELRSYFGLTLRAGELPSMVAEVAALFGPAYARLLELIRQQAALHIDETSWRVDGVPHWLWVFVNDLVALDVVSRSRGSKVPQALLGPDFALQRRIGAAVEKAKCCEHLLLDSHAYAKGHEADSQRMRSPRTLHER